jgi:hypothetical protein
MAKRARWDSRAVWLWFLAAVMGGILAWLDVREQRTASGPSVPPAPASPTSDAEHSEDSGRDEEVDVEIILD